MIRVIGNRWKLILGRILKRSSLMVFVLSAQRDYIPKIMITFLRKKMGSSNKVFSGIMLKTDSMVSG
jgi:hypothetical protein